MNFVHAIKTLLVLTFNIFILSNSHFHPFFLVGSPSISWYRITSVSLFRAQKVCRTREYKVKPLYKTNLLHYYKPIGQRKGIYGRQNNNGIGNKLGSSEKITLEWAGSNLLDLFFPRAHSTLATGRSSKRLLLHTLWRSLCNTKGVFKVSDE